MKNISWKMRLLPPKILLFLNAAGAGFWGSGGSKRHIKSETIIVTDFLNGVFSGNKEKVLSYIPDSEDKNYQREVSDMLSMISYAEENGEKKGEVKIGKLVKVLLKEKRYSDIEKVTDDEEYREKMYKEFGM